EDFVYKDKREGSVIIKFTQNERKIFSKHLDYDQDEIPHEVTISNFVNPLREQIPNFSYILDHGTWIFRYKNLKGEIVDEEKKYIVYEYIVGPTWEEWGK